MTSSFPYKIYSINSSMVLASLSLFGVILVPLLTILTNDSSILGTALLTLDLILGPLIIWIIGHKQYYKEDIKFIPYPEYFIEYECELHSHIDSPNFVDYLERIEDFLKSNNKLLLIYSLSGYGKSHLLKELSKLANNKYKNVKILFVKPDSYNLDMGLYLDKELNKREDYVIIFDDVDINSEDLKKLLSYCKNQDIQIILSFRSCELDVILENDNGLKREIINIEWKKQDLLYFLRDLRGQSTISDDGIIIKFNNPSLILTKLEAVNTPNFNFNKFDKLIENLDHDIMSCFSGFHHTRQDKIDLMINVACIVPFHYNNNEILNILKNQTNFEKDEIEEIIENLLNCGLLKLVNNSVRFNSDYIGYLYLFYKIKDFSIEKLEVLTNNLKSIEELWYFYPKLIYKNLGLTSQIVEIFLERVTTINITIIEHYFTHIINKWIDEEDTTLLYKRKENLGYLQYFCQVVSDNSLDLLNTYLDSNPPESKEYYLNTPLNTDDFGPTIIRLSNLSAIKNEIVAIILKMESKDINGMYGNYRPNELIKNLVSPFSNQDVDFILETLYLLESYLIDWSIPKINILSSALNEIFSVSKFDTRWGLHEFQSFPVELKETTNLIKIRNRGLSILKQMINHSSLEVKLEGLRIAEEIGDRDPKNELNLKNQLIHERSEIITEIASLINETTDFKLLFKIENLFLNWWALKTPGTELAENYLLNDFFPRTLLYITSKYMAENEFVVDDFDAFKNEAPEEERWKWYVSKKREYLLKIYEFKSYNELVMSLNEEYDTDIKIADLLVQLDAHYSEYSVNFINLIFECWFKYNPNLFVSLNKNIDLWTNVPEKFKGPINLALCDLDESYININAKEILSELPDV